MRRLELDMELAAVEAMPLAQLRETWSKHLEKPVPKASAAMLRLALAWELQAQVLGGHSRKTIQALEQTARGNTRTRGVQPGMRLTREWNGALYTVTIDNEGDIRWNDQTWKSLSAVARAITGTRWSGPAFFGLKTKVAA
ncbi:MAG: DUF2924 domain-containing protein [Pseudomonadota bacterium]